nr:MAG TPA: hypothetical protein [Caudoviricetes sp.]
MQPLTARAIPLTVAALLTAWMNYMQAVQVLDTAASNST